MKGQELSMALWALAKLERGSKAGDEEGVCLYRGSGTAQALAPHIVGLIPELSKQGLANVCWALGRLGVHPGEDALKRLEKAFVGEADGLTEQDIAMCLQAFARLDHAVGDELMCAITGFLKANGAGISVRAAAHILWGYAHNGSGPAPREVVSLLLSRLVSGGEQLTAVEVVSAATSLVKIKGQVSEEGSTLPTPREWDAAVDKLASVAASRASDERGVAGRLGPCEIG